MVLGRGRANDDRWAPEKNLGQCSHAARKRIVFVSFTVCADADFGEKDSLLRQANHLCDMALVNTVIDPSSGVG